MRGVAAIALALVLGGCSSTTTSPAIEPSDAGAIAVDATTTNDAAPDAERDARADVVDAAGYPADHVASPIVKTLGGPVLTAPNIVPVFYEGDPLQAQIEQFLTALAPSSYWTAATHEYGVGPLTVAPSIVVPAIAPQTIGDDDFEAFVISHLGAHGDWPAITENNVYVVFTPSGVVIDEGGGQVSCTAFGGYHAEASAVTDDEAGPDAGTTPFVYALVPRCAMFAGLTGIDQVTAAASHEIVESATDPFPYYRPAYDIVDAPQLVWAVAPLPEIGDMCAYEPQSLQRLVGTFMVQRIWSDDASKAGIDPCAPALDLPYYNVAPDLPDTVDLKYNGEPIATNGLKIPIGQTKTLDLRFFSSAPVDDWVYYVVDNSALYGGSPLLDFQPDQGTGNNGDVAHVSVTALATDSTIGGAEFTIYAYRGTNETYINYWFGFVGN